MLLNVAESGLTPQKLIQTYIDDEWEIFIREWMEGFDPPYFFVDKLGGSGDKGRDVVGYLGEPNSGCAWDSYQCKRYDKPLTPTQIYVELGKLCIFTLQGDYSIPRRYRFVSPRGVGPKLHDLLNKPEKLRQELIENWDKYCRDEISESNSYPLDEELITYIESFDFRIIGYVPAHEILNQHERTKYWSRRFKIDPPVRPNAPPPPDEVAPGEAVYLRCLFEAYADHLKQEVRSVEHLVGRIDLERHYHRTREFFYSAEMLSRFSRDHFTQGAFDKVKKQIYDGVVDVTCGEHSDAYRCVLATTQRSLDVPLSQVDLVPHVEPADRQGICHHLANDGQIGWKRP